MIGNRIKQLRTGKGLSQQAFAAQLSTKSGHISEIEQGKTQPGSPFLRSLKRAFPEVDLNWLLTGEEGKSGQPPVRVNVAAEQSESYISIDKMTPEQRLKRRLTPKLERIIDEGDKKKIEMIETQLRYLDPGEKKQGMADSEDKGPGSQLNRA